MIPNGLLVPVWRFWTKMDLKPGFISRTKIGLKKMMVILLKRVWYSFF